MNSYQRRKARRFRERGDRFVKSIGKAARQMVSEMRRAIDDFDRKKPEYIRRYLAAIHDVNCKAVKIRWPK